jgi:hypothetical protein
LTWLMVVVRERHEIENMSHRPRQMVAWIDSFCK